MILQIALVKPIGKGQCIGKAIGALRRKTRQRPARAIQAGEVIGGAIIHCQCHFIIGCIFDGSVPFESGHMFVETNIKWFAEIGAVGRVCGCRAGGRAVIDVCLRHALLVITARDKKFAAAVGSAAVKITLCGQRFGHNPFADLGAPIMQRAVKVNERGQDFGNGFAALDAFFAANDINRAVVLDGAVRGKSIGENGIVPIGVAIIVQRAVRRALFSRQRCQQRRRTFYRGRL